MSDIHPAHLEARYAMATRLSRFFYDNRFGSDWVAVAGDRFWSRVPKTAGEKHTPSPETRHLTLEYLRDLEAKQAVRGPSLEEIAEESGNSSWAVSSSDTISGGSIVPTPNNDARASHSSVLGPSGLSEASAGGTAANREGEGLSPSSQTLAAVSEDVCPPAGLNLSETQRGEQASLLTSYLPYQPHSPESRAAARKNKNQEQSDKLRILQLLRDRGPMTDDQIVEALGKDGNTARPRRRNLVQDELVTRVGTGKSALGNDCALWGLVQSQVSA